MADPSLSSGPSPSRPSRQQRPVVAITGANGTLGRALLRRWQERGARLIALTTCEEPFALQDRHGEGVPLQQVCWRAGRESELAELLQQVDVLVINHGVNVGAERSAAATDLSLEVNALSGWRLLELFAAVVRQRDTGTEEGPARPRPEVWVNTSEVEVEPAASPLYEISKRLLGQLLSLRALDLAPTLRLRRLVLGPFRSALNPIGVMDADWVAGQILLQAGWNCSLIIVTVNPLTYVTMPLTALSRWLYFRLFTKAAPSPGAAGTSADGRR